MSPPPLPALVPALVPPDDVRALLFDCDGTLLDTLPVYRRAWAAPFAEHGFEITDAWFDAHAGLAIGPFIASALPHIEPGQHPEIERAGLNAFLDELDTVTAFEHVVDVARAYTGRLPVGVVSAGRRDAVERSLEVSRIRDLFDFVITLDDVRRPKPAADGYLLAVDRLGISAEHVLAYEDSESGLSAARAAGVRAIDVRHH